MNDATALQFIGAVVAGAGASTSVAVVLIRAQIRRILEAVDRVPDAAQIRHILAAIERVPDAEWFAEIKIMLKERPSIIALLEQHGKRIDVIEGDAKKDREAFVNLRAQHDVLTKDGVCKR